MSQIVCIEGNIGSGKSTLLSVLKRYYEQHANNYTVNTKKHIFIEEPVDDWTKIKHENGKNMIECFYANQPKYAFSFQMMAYISRLVRLKEAIKEYPDAIIVVERSLYTDRYVFAKMLFDEEKMESVEYQIYLKWFDHFISDLPQISLIYVKTEPKICNSRIQKRKRSGEESIPLDYLEQCHIYHENMCELLDVPTLLLNGNSDKNTYVEYNDWIESIRNFIVPKAQ